MPPVHDPTAADLVSELIRVTDLARRALAVETPPPFDRWFAAGFNVQTIGHHFQDPPWICEISRHYDTRGSITPEAVVRHNGEYVTASGATALEAMAGAVNLAMAKWPEVIK